MSGWRTVLFEDSTKLSLSNGVLQAECNSETKTIPIEQLKTIMICNLQSSFTTALINELQKSNVSVIFCDERHNPNCEIINYHNNCFSAGRLSNQIKWTNETKAVIWQDIVKNKIQCQIGVLNKNSIHVADALYRYFYDVLPGDTTNREGQAARKYFNALFGSEFTRKKDNTINAALNYGYTILLSMVNRLISIHGYNNTLGIKHCSSVNPYNLGCDLMEPFRPFVDDFVYSNKDRELTRDYKHELIEIGSKKIIYDGKKTTLSKALSLFVPDVLSQLCDGVINIQFTEVYIP